MVDALITRCPTCGTVFRAAESQLLIRDGQVRCGRCDNVFDAYANVLSREGHEESQDVVAEGPAVLQNPIDEETPVHATADDSNMVPAKDPEQADPATLGAGPTRQDETKQAFELEHLLPPADNRAGGQDPIKPPAENAVTVLSEVLVLTPAPPHSPIAAAEDTFQSPAGPPMLADPNFELDFGPKEPPAGRISRWLAWPALAILCMLLLLQAAFHFRGDVALLFPDMKPPLEQACTFLGCDLPLPQRADMMSIESSDLQVDALHANIMVLSATLRNRAPFAQVAPALELTLTDARDQPLARRVLTAIDYMPDRTGRPFQAGTEIPVKVYFDASAVKPTGYRLYLFYP